MNRVRWIFERINARGLGGGTIGIEECTPSKRAQMQLGAPKAKLVDAGDIVEQMRWVKDADEIGVMRRATYFADYTVQPAAPTSRPTAASPKTRSSRPRPTPSPTRCRRN